MRRDRIVQCSGFVAFADIGRDRIDNIIAFVRKPPIQRFVAWTDHKQGSLIEVPHFGFGCADIIHFDVGH